MSKRKKRIKFETPVLEICSANYEYDFEPWVCTYFVEDHFEVVPAHMVMSISNYPRSNSLRCVVKVVPTPDVFNNESFSVAFYVCESLSLDMWGYFQPTYPILGVLIGDNLGCGEHTVWVSVMEIEMEEE
jgi:hypothetical protein